LFSRQPATDLFTARHHDWEVASAKPAADQAPEQPRMEDDS
jgi:hypothetical protein